MKLNFSPVNLRKYWPQPATNCNRRFLNSFQLRIICVTTYQKSQKVPRWEEGKNEDFLWLPWRVFEHNMETRLEPKFIEKLIKPNISNSKQSYTSNYHLLKFGKHFQNFWIKFLDKIEFTIKYRKTLCLWCLINIIVFSFIILFKFYLCLIVFGSIL